MGGLAQVFTRHEKDTTHIMSHVHGEEAKLTKNIGYDANFFTLLSR